MASGKRKENESFSDYRERLKYVEALKEKRSKKGRLVWDSRNGTYKQRSVT